MRNRIDMQPTKKRSKTTPAAPKRRAKRSSEEIMQRLIAAAQDEFKRSGFMGATTAAIARKAEITEAQLFRYFSSKAELFREAVFEPLNRHFADTAVFRFSEVRLGIIPAVISPYVLAAIGTRAARRYFLNGESFPAAEAVRIGLLHGSCTLEEFGGVTAQMVAELLAGKKHAQTAIKSLLDAMSRPRIDEQVIEDTVRRLADIRATPEAQAALAEFLSR